MSDPQFEVEGAPTYQGVRVNHPTIVATIQNMVKQGKKLEEIMRITGMPGEVVRKYMT